MKDIYTQNKADPNLDYKLAADPLPGDAVFGIYYHQWWDQNS